MHFSHNSCHLPYIRSLASSSFSKIHGMLIVTIVWLAPFQFVAPLAANNLQSGLSSATSVASFTLRLWYDKLFFILAIQEV